MTTVDGSWLSGVSGYARGDAGSGAGMPLGDGHAHIASLEFAPGARLLEAAPRLDAWLWGPSRDDEGGVYVNETMGDGEAPLRDCPDCGRTVNRMYVEDGRCHRCGADRNTAPE